MNNDIGDNKFLKVLIAAQRAKQLHKGARPLIQKSNARATRMALEEVERGLINFEHLPQVSDLRSGRDNRGDGRQAGAGETNLEVTDQTSVAKLGD
jgi:DNA-directed RNA polymerase omega subunit